jgi:hypothetical protein
MIENQETTLSLVLLRGIWDYMSSVLEDIEKKG